nr:hypothetical protein [Gemmatimonadaceae bacterium]
MTEGHSAAAGVRELHSLFGFRMASDHTFLTRLAPAEAGTPELTLRSVSESPLPPGWDSKPRAYESTAKIDDQQSFLSIIVAEECTIFRFTEVVDFFIFPTEIVYQLLDAEYAFMVELHFLGFVLSYWLERRRIPAIHAAAVVVDERAVGFISTNKGGKSSLAASFMAAGHALLTDDIMAIDRTQSEYIVRPSYPQMRMWPEQATFFLGSYETLQQVHPRLTKRRVPVGSGGLGTFRATSAPLGRIYLPQRRDGGGITFTDLSLSEAVFALARYSFLTDIVEHVGLHRKRFAVLADVARAV